MSTTSYYISKESYHSFVLPCDANDLTERMVRKACEIWHEEVMEQAAKNKQHCKLKWEVVRGMDNIRVNISSGTAKDAAMIGYNFAIVQMNPSLM